jgi:hypothetical protein
LPAFSPPSKLPPGLKVSFSFVRAWPIAVLATLCAPAACSSTDAATPPPANVTGRERDTEIKHEPCDGKSAAAQRVDVNSDNRPDIIHVRQAGREVCRIVDMNLDGAIDAYIYYDVAGLERRRESDFDRDGRPDEVTFLQGGVPIRKERETNFDNKIDTWDYYEFGRLVRRERDSDGDRVIDQWWNFDRPTEPMCAMVANDRNADGKPDPGTVVDLCGESYGVPAAAPKPVATPPSGPAPAPAAGAPATVPVPPAAAPGVPPPAPSPSLPAPPGGKLN